MESTTFKAENCKNHLPVELDTRLDAFLAATADIDLPLAFTQQWQPDRNRCLATYSLSAPDLRSLLDYLRSLSTPARDAPSR